MKYIVTYAASGTEGAIWWGDATSIYDAASKCAIWYSLPSVYTPAEYDERVGILGYLLVDVLTEEELAATPSERPTEEKRARDRVSSLLVRTLPDVLPRRHKWAVDPEKEPYLLVRCNPNTGSPFLHACPEKQKS